MEARVGLTVDAPDIDVEAGTPLAWREHTGDGITNRVVITARAGGMCDATLRIGSVESTLCEAAPLGEILATVNMTIATLLGGSAATDGQGHSGPITYDELVQRVGEVTIVTDLADTLFGDGGLGF